MTDEDFMRLAIKEAKKSKEPLKCGAVIVKDGKVISKAFNSQRAGNNATAHAEIKLISQTGKKLGNKNLENCTIYCTCEPCTMCLSAMVFAKVKKLFYGVSLKKVSLNLIDIGIDELLERSPNNFEVVKIFF